mmetsp:Transcript_5836/g.8299  ORF Transcript_5836/g.8299 Transcript_5836/m.8299 type:complete len:156 (-) Transcript_5836:410-877(-)
MASSSKSGGVVLTSRRSLYVGGVAEECKNDATLRAAFLPFGPLKSVELPLDYSTGKHRGFCFVEYEDPEDAAEALDNMEGSELMGRVLNVSLAQPNQLAKAQQAGANNPHKAIWSSDEWFQQQQGQDGEEKEESKKAQANEAVETLKEKAAVRHL